MGQHCALLWPKMRSHRDVSVTRRGTAPMGFDYNNMADTTNATYDGGIYVPHWNLSGANISINHKTAKLSSIFFSDGIKNKERRALNPASLMY